MTSGHKRWSQAIVSRVFIWKQRGYVMQTNLQEKDIAFYIHIEMTYANVYMNNMQGMDKIAP